MNKKPAKQQAETTTESDEDSNKYILLMCDPKTGKWHINVQTSDPEFAQSEHDQLKDRDTPTILIYTGDFVTV